MAGFEPLNCAHQWLVLKRPVTFAAKVPGRAHPPQGWNPPRKAELAKLLPGDHITCLAEDAASRIWIGFWRNGFLCVDPKTGRSFSSSQEAADQKPDGYVSTLLPLGHSGMLIGRYGSGISAFGGGEPLADTRSASSSARSAVRFPSAALSPGAAWLSALLARLDRVRLHHLRPGEAVALPDDWRTQGNWLGRHGTYFADLAAWVPHGDFHWGTGHARRFAEEILACPQIGSHHEKGDSIRRWVQWNSTANAHVLEMPAPFLDNRVYFGLGHWSEPRREAEWDDHGETYPFTYQGPSVYVGLRIPKGEFFLSIYEFNKDGHAGANRLRDYAVSLRPEPYNYPIAELHSLHNTAPARNRVVNFWGGVWERFVVCGPAQYQLAVARNFSLNTILQAVMLDRPTSEPFPYFSPKNRYNRVRPPAMVRHRRPAARALLKSLRAAQAPAIATAIINQLRLMRARDPALWARLEEQDYTQLARALLVDSPASGKAEKRQMESALGRCYYEIGLFHRWEVCQMACGLFPARLVEKNLRWQGEPQFGCLDDRYLVEAYLAGECGKPPHVQPHADYFRNSVVDEFDHPGAW